MALTSSTDHEFGPRVALRFDSNVELSYWAQPPFWYQPSVYFDFDFGVFGESLSAGSPVGTPFVVSQTGNIREMTPAIACMSSKDCAVVYRWFDPADPQTDADQIKARTLSY